ncbi:MAG: glycosyltransferase family 2 protein [Oscillospiraceae bacterium]|nr:glycosyltransferase family 2 protein [Oscillospiraceae bacterium]MDY4586634.1 glycosyltransferase family 2 protein [Oscillospiraceae bacterium]
MKILVIIPCYNEQESIERVIENLKANAPFADYLIVNDCSTDKTLRILQANGMNYINNPVNLGIGGGVQAGYLYARENGYDVAVQMDGDGQHDPKYLEKVCAPVIDGTYDMCIGSRFIEKEGFQSSFMRRLGINIISFMIKLFTGKKIYDVTSGYRACNKELINFFADNYADDYPEPEAIITSVLSGFKVGEVPVVMVERQGGTSSIRSLKSAYYMIKVCLALVVDRIKVRKAGK